MRIVSLLPSATEIVCALGLGDQLVGVTHECDYPPAVRSLPKVTHTLIPTDAASRDIDEMVRAQLKTDRTLYKLDPATLERVQPDLIVTQTLCDVCAVAASDVAAAVCRLPGRPKVVNLEPTRLEDVFESMLTVGEAAGVAHRAMKVVSELKARVAMVATRASRIAKRPRVVLLEWIDPPFSSGHWSPELVELAGGREMLGRAGERSRGVDWEEIVRADPEVLVVACCGFDIERTKRDLPILRGHAGYEGLSCVRAGRIHVVDGNAYFSRPGPRLVESLELLAELIHPSAGIMTAAAARAHGVAPLP
ncbi:MAG: cobalamin-binding protein [Phycisphaerae bacterium]|nr:MAG: cobalamin-binding protein [Planctomycetia bacterium]RIK67163.1 MAG: cobalamin-binding protein [Planctomycetota bacterium]GJQ27276.1 MAG: cobalamin-binding protein [Phycisphaerae bacterium]